jgi:hypothetical protein
MDEAQLFEWLSQMEAQNPGALKQMIDAGLMGDRMGVEGQNVAMGKDMWDVPMAQGQRVGGTYVASSPVEHLSNAMSKVMGAKMMGDSQARQQALINQKGGGMDAFIRAMAQQRPPVQQPPQPSPFIPGWTPDPFAGP